MESLLVPVGFALDAVLWFFLAKPILQHYQVGPFADKLTFKGVDTNEQV